MRRSTNAARALAAGAIAAILASACCLGPLALVALGFSGAWIGDLSVFEPYRPLFVGAALLALFFAWRRIFRARGVCRPDGICASPRARTAYKTVFWIVTVLVFVAVTFPYVLPMFYRKEPTMQKLMMVAALVLIAGAPAWAATKTLTLHVPGMTCTACPITVKTALSRVDGVSKVDVIFAKREARVTFDDARANVTTLLRATAKAGYPSSVEH